VAAAALHGAVPARADVAAIAALGVCLFLNQLLYILGLQLAGVTAASCMQPSIPVLTVALSMAARAEAVSALRIAGAPALRRECRQCLYRPVPSHSPS
jgi:drug/metabolite transporter (DMT)-like permease